MTLLRGTRVIGSDCPAVWKVSGSFEPGSIQAVGWAGLATMSGTLLCVPDLGPMPLKLISCHRFEPARQNQRSIHGRLHAFVIGHGRGVELHRKSEFNLVPVPPYPIQSQIAAWARKYRKSRAIDFYAASFCPVGNAKFHR